MDCIELFQWNPSFEIGDEKQKKHKTSSKYLKNKWLFQLYKWLCTFLWQIKNENFAQRPIKMQNAQ